MIAMLPRMLECHHTSGHDLGPWCGESLCTSKRYPASTCKLGSCCRASTKRCASRPRCRERNKNVGADRRHTTSSGQQPSRRLDIGHPHPQRTARRRVGGAAQQSDGGGPAGSHVPIEDLAERADSWGEAAREPGREPVKGRAASPREATGRTKRPWHGGHYNDESLTRTSGTGVRSGFPRFVGCERRD